MTVGSCFPSHLLLPSQRYKSKIDLGIKSDYPTFDFPTNFHALLSIKVSSKSFLFLSLNCSRILSMTKPEPRRSKMRRRNCKWRRGVVFFVDHLSDVEELMLEIPFLNPERYLLYREMQIILSKEKQELIPIRSIIYENSSDLEVAATCLVNLSKNRWVVHSKPKLPFSSASGNQEKAIVDLSKQRVRAKRPFSATAGDEEENDREKKKMKKVKEPNADLSRQRVHTKQPCSAASGNEEKAIASSLIDLSKQRVLTKLPYAVAGDEEEKERKKKKMKKERLTCSDVVGPDPPPELPANFKEIIEAKGGSNAILVIQKKLRDTDVSPPHNRLSIPPSQIMNEFLTEEEKELLNMKNGKGKKEHIEALLIGPSAIDEYKVNLVKWDMAKGQGQGSWTYNLIKTWNSIVSGNNLSPPTIVQLWAFRVGSQLNFALVQLGKEEEVH